jgi:hypothetical protein
MTDPDRRRSAIAEAVVLTKREVFVALEACAAGERVLLRCGRPAEAAGLSLIFELLEDRVVLDPPPAGYEGGSEGSNANDNELMQ